MKRLKNKLLGMEPNNTTYESIYNGSITVHDRSCPTMPPINAYDSTYYHENIAFSITHTHKLAKDKPTITIAIPIEQLLSASKGDIYLKRLKYFLLQMQNETASYKEMYEGIKTVIFTSTAWNGHTPDPETEYDSKYWYKDISFFVEQTNKLAQDKPTLTWNIPVNLLSIQTYTIAAADFCLRTFGKYIDELNNDLYNRSRPDNENGKYYLHTPGGEVLARNSAFFALCPQKDYENGPGSDVYLLNDGKERPPVMCLCIRMQVQLPKKKIRKCIQMLCHDLPYAVDNFISDFDICGLNEVLALSEKQIVIRNWLKNSDYCSFIADGSILPRSEDTDLPMKNAVPFKSTTEDEIVINGISGMGFKRGVTVITGGGYSGKSTVLDAISAGIYNHILGDGRELCITDDSAVTICAEDSRSVKNVNISPFIKWLPSGDTKDFSTKHASGSTSQAANIMEAIDYGSKLLLIDEDRSATNFMIRDKIMKTLIQKEPITPFTDRVNEIFNTKGVSTILVIGGSGEYLSVADNVFLMDNFSICNVTEYSKSLCCSHGLTAVTTPNACWEQTRTLCSERFISYPQGSGSERLEVSDMGFILIGDESIDIRGLHNIITPFQVNALGFMLRYLEISNNKHIIDIFTAIDELYKKIEKEGLDCIYSSFFTTTERFLDLPRKCDLLAVINRMRNIKFIKTAIE